MGAIYAVQEPLSGLVKIGWTSGKVRKRIAKLQVSCPTRLISLGWLPAQRSYEIKLHRRFGKAHVRGEWFDPKRSKRLKMFLKKLEPLPLIQKSKEKKIRSAYAKRTGRRRRIGFAMMSKDRRSKVGRKGGRRAHRKGVAHRFTSEEATRAIQTRWENWEKKIRGQ